MAKGTKKIIYAMLSIFLLSFIIYQLWISGGSGLVTETVETYTAFDGIESSAVALRSEALITYDVPAGNVVAYSSAGQRVQKGGAVAEVYPDQAAAEARSMADKIQSQINILTSQNEQDTSMLDINTLDKQSESGIVAVLTAVNEGSPGSANDNYTALLENLNNRQNIGGSGVDYTSKINELKKSLATYQSEYSANATQITTPNSGLFVKGTDGYENAFNLNNIANMNVSQFESLKETAEPSNAIGRVMTDFNWYTAFEVTPKEAMRLSVGNNYTATFTSLPNDKIAETILAINSSPNGKFLVVASSNNMDDKLININKGTIKLQIDSPTGLRVNKNSVHVVNKQTGVYVLVMTQVKWVPVNIIFAGTDYYLCTSKDPANPLNNFDQAIVNGKGLYNNKIVK